MSRGRERFAEPAIGTAPSDPSVPGAPPRAVIPSAAQPKNATGAPRPREARVPVPHVRAALQRAAQPKADTAALSARRPGTPAPHVQAAVQSAAQSNAAAAAPAPAPAIQRSSKVLGFGGKVLTEVGTRTTRDTFFTGGTWDMTRWRRREGRIFTTPPLRTSPIESRQTGSSTSRSPLPPPRIPGHLPRSSAPRLPLPPPPMSSHLLSFCRRCRTLVVRSDLDTNGLCSSCR